MNPDGSGKRKINLNLDRQITNLTWESSGQGLYFQYDSEGNYIDSYIWGANEPFIPNNFTTDMARDVVINIPAIISIFFFILIKSIPKIVISLFLKYIYSYTPIRLINF